MKSALVWAERSFGAKMKPTDSVKAVLLQTTFVLLTVLFALSFTIVLCWIIYDICRRRNATEEIPMREMIVVRRPHEEDNGAVPDVVNANIAMNGIPAIWRVKEGTSSSKTQTTDCDVKQQHDLPVDDQTNEEGNDLSNLDTLLEVQEFKVPDVVITDTTEVEAGQYYILLRSKADGKRNPKSVQNKAVEAMIKANETLIEAHVEANEGALDQVMTESTDPIGSCLAKSRVDLGMNAKMVDFREMDSMSKRSKRSKPSTPTWV